MATQLGTKFIAAMAYASWLHADQIRKDTDIPYVSHLLGAASLVLDQGGDEDEAVAALLHDALEDCPDRTSAEEIRARFGDKVARIVVACTDATTIPKPPWRPRKHAYIAHLEDQPEDVLRVSLADKLHNARAIVADHRVVGAEVWKRFSAPPAEQAWYYTSLLDVFRRRSPSALVVELGAVVGELAAAAESAA